VTRDRKRKDDLEAVQMRRGTPPGSVLSSGKGFGGHQTKGVKGTSVTRKAALRSMGPATGLPSTGVDPTITREEGRPSALEAPEKRPGRNKRFEIGATDAEYPRGKTKNLPKKVEGCGVCHNLPPAIPSHPRVARRKVGGESPGGGKDFTPPAMFNGGGADIQASWGCHHLFLGGSEKVFMRRSRRSFGGLYSVSQDGNPGQGRVNWNPTRIV